jgi:hypothetical protein
VALIIPHRQRLSTSWAYLFRGPSFLERVVLRLAAAACSVLVAAVTLGSLNCVSEPPRYLRRAYLLIVSSTLKIKQAASVAACRALTLTRLGSHTNFSMLFAMLSVVKSTPAQTLPFLCSTLNRLRMSVASTPALSHSCLGMTSNAFAKALIIGCCLCGMFLSA